MLCLILKSERVITSLTNLRCACFLFQMTLQLLFDFLYSLSTPIYFVLTSLVGLAENNSQEFYYSLLLHHLHLLSDYHIYLESDYCFITTKTIKPRGFVI